MSWLTDPLKAKAEVRLFVAAAVTRRFRQGSDYVVCVPGADADGDRDCGEKTRPARFRRSRVMEL